MTNKRQLKKYISRMGAEIAEILLPMAVYTKQLTEEAAETILDKLSQLEAQALSRISIAYDKKPEAFENVAAYKSAKAKYFHTAYGQALKDFEAGVDTLLAEINKEKK